MFQCSRVALYRTVPTTGVTPRPTSCQQGLFAANRSLTAANQALVLSVFVGWGCQGFDL